MKILQINAWYFTLFENLLAFVKEENPDIVLLQEVWLWVLNLGNESDPLERFKELWYFVAHGKEYGIVDKWKHVWSRWVAVLSKNYFVSKMVEYVEYLGWYREYTPKEALMDIRDANKTSAKDKLRTYQFCWTTPSPTLVATTTDTMWNEMHILTAHFKVSERCTMTYQMLEHAKSVAKIVAKLEWPIIFWWDLNIYDTATVLDPLRSVMDQVTNALPNSLNTREHILFQRDTSHTGYGVDHIFQRWCEVVSWRVRDDVDVSDHLPIECIIN